jgi:hypothetical protein
MKLDENNPIDLARIEPNVLYRGARLKALLKGFVSLTKLRKHGLVGLPGMGYFGENILLALKRYCSSMGSERNPVLPQEKEEEHGELFENSDQELLDQGNPQRRQLGGNRRNRRRRAEVQAVGTQQGPVESQLEKLDRKAAATDSGRITENSSGQG